MIQNLEHILKNDLKQKGVKMSTLKHTEETITLIKADLKAEAIARHNAKVQADFEEATQGKIICLTDLIAAREKLEQG